MAGEPDERLSIGPCDLRILGTVAGAVPDGDRVAAAIEEHEPEVVALGIPDEDLGPLAQLVADPALADDLPEIDGPEALFLAELARHGDVLVAPSPDLAAAHRTGLPLHAIDLDDHEHTRLFTETVKVRHLMQRSSARKKAEKRDWSTSADRFELAREWDRMLARAKPLRRLEEDRERHMAERLRDLARDHRSLVAVVPVARFAGVVSRLRTDGT